MTQPTSPRANTPTEDATMNPSLLFALFLFLSTSSPAFAHGTESTLMGTVTAVAADSITVKATDGDVVLAPIDERTEFYVGAATAVLADVDVGRRVVIEFREGDEPSARVVRLPPSRPTNSEPPPGSGQNEHDHGGHQ